MVNLYYLEKEHLYSWPSRLSTTIRANSLRLEGRSKTSLVWRQKPTGRLGVQQTGQKRLTPDYEAG